MHKTFNTALAEFGESLQVLDMLRAEFKEHPMYAEWLDNDQVNVTHCICGDEDCEECNWQEDDEIDELIENLYE